MNCIFCQNPVKLDNPYANGFHTGHITYNTGDCDNCPISVAYAWDLSLPGKLNNNIRIRSIIINSKLIYFYNFYSVKLDFTNNRTYILKYSSNEFKTVASFHSILDITPSNFNDYMKRLEKLIVFS